VDLVSALQFASLRISKQTLIAANPETATLLSVSNAFVEEVWLADRVG
jgi:hypothetical protein